MTSQHNEEHKAFERISEEERIERALQHIKRNGVMPFVIGRGHKSLGSVAEEYRSGGIFIVEYKLLQKEAEKRGITLERLYAETICDKGQLEAYEAGVPLRDILA